MEIHLLQDETLVCDKLSLAYKAMNALIEGILKAAKQDVFTLEGTLNGTKHFLDLSSLYYFESVDKKTFAYTQNQIYDIPQPLYDIEDMLSTYGFVRINKSVIINLYRVKCVKAQANMRIQAELQSGEQQIISRHYKKNFQTRLDQLLSVK